MNVPALKRIVPLVSAVILLLLPAVAVSAPGEAAQLSITMDVAKVVRVKEGDSWILKREPAETAQAGDVLIYTITYKNEGDRAIQNAAIIGPIPGGTEYVVESASQSASSPQYSIDGGKSFVSPPVMYTVRNPDGRMEEKVAPVEMYSHIKWVVETFILPGESGFCEYKVRVKEK